MLNNRHNISLIANSGVFVWCVYIYTHTHICDRPLSQNLDLQQSMCGYLFGYFQVKRGDVHFQKCNCHEDSGRIDDFHSSTSLNITCRCCGRYNVEPVQFCDRYSYTYQYIIITRVRYDAIVINHVDGGWWKSGVRWTFSCITALVAYS